MKILAPISIAIFASTAMAFDVDLEKYEVAKLQGRYLIEDIIAPGKGRMQHPCVLDGRLYVIKKTPLYETGDFIVQMGPDETVELFFEPLDYKGQPITELREEARPPFFMECEKLEAYDPSWLLPVSTIDGFDTYSAWGVFVREKFPMSE